MKCVADTSEVLPDQSVLAGFCEETKRFLIVQPDDLQEDRGWKPTIRHVFSLAGASNTQWEDTIVDSLKYGTHDGLWRLPTHQEALFIIMNKAAIGADIANEDNHQRPVYWTARGHFSIGVGRDFHTGKADVYRDNVAAATRLVRSVSPETLEQIRESSGAPLCGRVSCCSCRAGAGHRPERSL